MSSQSVQMHRARGERSVRVACASLLVVLTSSLRGAHADTPQPAGAPVADLRELIEQFHDDDGDIERFYNLPWSELRFDRLSQAYDDGSKLLKQVDFANLNQAGRIDYLLLRNYLQLAQARLARQRETLTKIDDLLPFRKTILDLEVARRRMEPVDAQVAAGKLAGLPEQIKKVRERIEQGKAAPAEVATTGPAASSSTATEPDASAPLRVAPVAALEAAGAASALHGTLNEWYSYSGGYQPDFNWWVKQPFEAAAAALDEYAKYLRESIAGLHGGDDDPLIGEPLGAAVLSQYIAAEMLPYSPEELIAIGEREIAWCEVEMKKAAAQMGLGDDWKAALEKVKNDHAPPGEMANVIAAQVRETIKFLKDRELITIPPLAEETWRLTMIGPEEQKVLPFAAYGGQNIMVAAAAESMKYEDKLAAMRGNNRHVSRVFVLHELIPGHHLQAFMTERHRRYRGMFGTPFFVEGWPLYWEMTLWDMGYAQTPEDRVGMLFWRMHRAARIVVSLKFHLGQMTPTEMIDFLINRIGHDRFGATGEVRRFISDGYTPLYPCGYMIGGLQLRALRKEVVDTGKMTDRQFHDALMTYGAIPIELIRADMLNLPLTPETKSSWRFGSP